MAPRRRRTNNRRRRRKRRYYRKRTVGFPITLTTKLRYNFVSKLALNSGNAYSNQYILSLNSLYDVDVTGTGGQPQYYDQLTTVYNEYQVYGAKVTVTLVNEGVSHPVYYNFYPTTAGSQTESPWVNSMDTKSSKLFVISSEGSNNMKTFSKYYNIPKELGVSKVQYKDGQYQAFVTGRPSTELLLYLNMATNATSDQTVQLIFRVTLYAKFFSIKNVSPS